MPSLEKPPAGYPAAPPPPGAYPGPGGGPALGVAGQPVAPAVAAAERNWVLLCYLIHVIGPFTGQLLPVLGVILNHVFYGQSQTLLARSHHRWMLRTFWFWLLWFVLALVVLAVGFGGFFFAAGRPGLWLGSNIAVGASLILATIIWWWYRTILGLVRFSRNQPMYVPGAAVPWR